jgi:hypothetical protein
MTPENLPEKLIQDKHNVGEGIFDSIVEELYLLIQVSVTVLVFSWCN